MKRERTSSESVCSFLYYFFSIHLFTSFLIFTLFCVSLFPDFRWEARNARTFADSLAFLGYVTVPQALPEYTVGPNVLVNEWIHGRHLSDLDRKEGLRMTSMAVEAVTAGLVLTGQVHADPHEGNVMLANDGRLVFLGR